MKEAKFTTETVRSVRHHGGWAYKIPDAPITKEILKITRFTAAKPCDIVCCIDGRMIAIETKQFKKWEALGLRHFEPEQIEGMNRIVANGGRAFVFLNIRIKKPYTNRLLVFEWDLLYEHFTLFGSVFAKDLMKRTFYESFLIGEEPNQKRVFDLSEWRRRL